MCPCVDFRKKEQPFSRTKQRSTNQAAAMRRPLETDYETTPECSFCTNHWVNYHILENNSRWITHDWCLHRQTYEVQQLWHKSTKRHSNSEPSFPQRLPRPHFLHDASLLCLNPAHKPHISSSCRPKVRRATRVSSTAAEMQNVGKTHKCQMLFAQSGYMSVALWAEAQQSAAEALRKKKKPRHLLLINHNNLCLHPKIHSLHFRELCPSRWRWQKNRQNNTLSVENILQTCSKCH